MSQRSVELLVGRLITDEAFRRCFVSDPGAVLSELAGAGHALSSVEVTALTATDPGVWGRLAEALDPRLLKADLKAHR